MSRDPAAGRDAGLGDPADPAALPLPDRERGAGPGQARAEASDLGSNREGAPDLLPDRAVTRAELAALGLLVLLGAFLRSYRLGDWPPGFHVDEAFNLLDARAMIQTGWRPVFLPANAGRDVLYSYLQAPLLWILGESVAHARLASAWIGTLTIPLFWLTARRLLASDRTLPPERLRRLALLAAGFASLSLWHLHFSRFGIRAVLFPAVVCGVVLAWWRVVQPFLPAGDPRSSDASPGPSGPPEPGEPREPSDPPRLAAARDPQDLSAATRAHDKAGRRPLVALALLLGLAFYTHPAGRALVALPAAHALVLAWRGRDAGPLRLLARAFGGALLVAAPLLAFWWRHPAAFSSHAGEVSILGQGWQALWDNLLRVAGMFTVAGDGKPWRNLVTPAGLGRPVFGWGPGSAAAGGVDLFFGLLLPLTGLVIWLAAARQGRPWAVMGGLWLLVLLLPSASTDQAPNLSRSIGALPPAFLLLACGLEWFPGGLRGRLDLRAQDGLEAGLWNLAAALFLGLFGLQSWRDYRGWMAAPQTPLAFDADKVALAEHIDAKRAAGGEVYLTPAMAAHPTVRSLVRAPVRGFDGRFGFVLPAPEVARVSYLSLASEGDAGADFACDKVARAFALAGRPPEVARARPSSGDAPWPVAPLAAQGLRGCTVDQFPAASSGEGLPTVAEDAVLGGRVGLAALSLTGDGLAVAGRPRDFLGSGSQAPPAVPLQPGADLTLHVIWQTLTRLPPDLNIAIQVVDANDQGLAQADGPPLAAIGGSSSYPSELWQPGETVITYHPLRIPADTPPGMATLRIGLYDWRAGTPLLTKAGESVLPVLRWRVGGEGVPADAATPAAVPPPR